MSSTAHEVQHRGPTIPFPPRRLGALAAGSPGPVRHAFERASRLRQQRGPSGATEVPPNTSLNFLTDTVNDASHAPADCTRFCAPLPCFLCIPFGRERMARWAWSMPSSVFAEGVALIATTQ